MKQKRGSEWHLLWHRLWLQKTAGKGLWKGPRLLRVQQQTGQDR